MTKRIRLFNYLVVCFFIVAISKAFYLQILNGQIYKRKSFQQSHTLKKIEPNRGLIIDSQGIPLVTNQTRYEVSLYKPNLTSTQNSLQSVFVEETELINNFFNNTNQKWITLKGSYDESIIDIVPDSNGIIIKPINIRFYPEEDLALDVLGFVGKNKNGSFIGYNGLEGFYNQTLTGKSGFIWQTKDAMGNSILSNINWARPKIDGSNLETTIHKNIQYIVESELEKSLSDYQADSASAIIMDSQTGDIIAMSTKDASPSAVPKNRVITDIYEPGSIFKPITLAIAIDSQSIQKDFICKECHKNRYIDGHQIKNWNSQNHPDSTIFDIIRNSDNIGMTYIMDNIKLDTFLSYCQKLKLNQKTGIDLQGEAKSKFTKNFWSQVEKATASFGQGFAITNIQAITAFNTIATNGFYIKPSIVKNLTNKKDNTVNVFNKQTTDFIKQVLKYTVEKSNLTKLNSTNIDLCGKSGTAQVAESGQYGQNTTASYIAFTPCDQPKYTMSVTIRNPKTTPWGETTAAPIWFSIAQKISLFI